MADDQVNVSEEAQQSGFRGWLRRQRGLFKIYIIFILFIVILFSLLVTPWGKDYISIPLNKLIASLSGFLVSLFSSDVVVAGTRMTSDLGSVDIKEGCNGIYATVILLAGVVAFPATWRQKLIGVVFGTVALFAINIIRVITLFYLSRSYPKLFDEAHMFIWQFVIIICGGLLWLVWYDKIVNRSPREASL